MSKQFDRSGRHRSAAAAVVCSLVLLAGIFGCAGPAEQVPEGPVLTELERERFAQAESRLRSPDAEVRRQAAVALLSMDHPAGVQAVREALQRAQEPAVRASMVRAVEFCEDHRCFDAVLAATRDPAALVQEAAAQALARFTRPEEVEQMMALARAPETSPSQRELIYRALGNGLAVQAVPVLLEGLQSEREQTRLAAWGALRYISARDLPLDPPRWRAWWEANSHKSRKDVLEEHLRVASGELRAHSRRLEQLKEEREELMALVEAPERETLGLLLEALHSEHAVVRRYAAFRLAALPEGETPAGVLDDKRVYTLLRDALDAPEDSVRVNVMRFIQEAEGEYRNLLISKALQDENPEVLAMAAEGVSASAGQEAVPRLEELLRKSPHREVRVTVANMLGKVGSEESRSALMAALDDPAENVRWFAVEGLRKLGATRAVPRISEILRADESARVRAIAASTLGELGQPAGVPALRQALGDPVERVREKAASALLMLARGSCERMMVIAGAFRENGLREEARQVLERVIDRYGAEPGAGDRVAPARSKLAQMLKEKGDYAGAAALYRQLIASGHADAEVRAALIRCWMKAGQTERVVETLQEWLPAGTEPGMLELAVEVAGQFVEQNRMEEARALIESVETAAGQDIGEELKNRIEELKIRLGS